MLNELLGYLIGSKLIVCIIGVMVALFVVAIIRYLFDRSGGYF